MRTDECFSIKQMADLFGKTRGAIRFFQEKGLVEPHVDEKGARYYTVDDFLQLFYLRRFAAMSFSLDDVSAHLRLESTDDLGQLIDLLDERASGLQADIDALTQQLRSLQQYRGDLIGARDGTWRIEQVGEYWGLTGDRIQDMAREEPETLARLVSLDTSVVVGGTYRRSQSAGRGCPRSDLRIDASAARDAGLAYSRFFYVLPPTQVARRIVRVSSDDLHPDLWGEIVAFATELQERGLQPGNEAFGSLVLVHTEASVPVEYHAIIVPVADEGSGA